MYEAQHIDRCRKAYGKSWVEVHRFLDQYADEFGPAHRRIFHHQAGIEIIVRNFGEDARGPAEQHILDDLRTVDPLITIIPVSWEWYGTSEFLRPSEKKKLKNVLTQLYGNDFTIALDLEGTLITSEKDRIPRPGLFQFLEACRQLGHVVLYTMVDKDTTQEIAQELVAGGHAPEWFARVEWVDWFTHDTDHKDLRLIPGASLYNTVLVDDHPDFVAPGQRRNWIEIKFFDPQTPDNEFDEVLQIIKMKKTISRETRLYEEYNEYCSRLCPTPKLHQEMIRRHSGKIKVLALDLEWTLITVADVGRPRPGLYNFLTEVEKLFERIVIYTAATEDMFRKVAQDLVDRGKAPGWFTDLEYIKWSRKGYKDLSRVSGIKPHEALIIDDHRPYINPEQLFQWIYIQRYGEVADYNDFEFNRVLGVLELIQLKTINRERVLSYLKEEVDYDASGIQKLWIYGPIAKGVGRIDSTLEIAIQIDPKEKKPVAKHIPANQFEKNIQHTFRNYFWIDVKFTDQKNEDGVVIINTWEAFNAVFLRTPGRIEIIFPDLPGCKGECLKKEKDEYFDDTSMQAYQPAREILNSWLQTVTEDDIPEKRFTEKNLIEQYPGSDVHRIYGQLPWKKNEMPVYRESA